MWSLQVSIFTRVDKSTPPSPSPTIKFRLSNVDKDCTFQKLARRINEDAENVDPGWASRFKVENLQDADGFLLNVSDTIETLFMPQQSLRVIAVPRPPTAFKKRRREQSPSEMSTKRIRVGSDSQDESPQENDPEKRQIIMENDRQHEPALDDQLHHVSCRVNLDQTRVVEPVQDDNVHNMTSGTGSEVLVEDSQPGHGAHGTVPPDVPPLDELGDSVVPVIALSKSKQPEQAEDPDIYEHIESDSNDHRPGTSTSHNESLDASASKTWSRHDDTILLEAHGRDGVSFKKIAETVLRHKSKSACVRRYHVLKQASPAVSTSIPSSNLKQQRLPFEHQPTPVQESRAESSAMGASRNEKPVSKRKISHELSDDRKRLDRALERQIKAKESKRRLEKLHEWHKASEAHAAQPRNVYPEVTASLPGRASTQSQNAEKSISEDEIQHTEPARQLEPDHINSREGTEEDQSNHRSSGDSSSDDSSDDSSSDDDSSTSGEEGENMPQEEIYEPIFVEQKANSAGEASSEKYHSPNEVQIKVEPTDHDSSSDESERSSSSGDDAIAPNLNRSRPNGSILPSSSWRSMNRDSQRGRA